MSNNTIQVLIAMICYMSIVIGIGIYFAKRANESSDNYFLGGRSLGPWVAAMSAAASDMSGWLLMGLPGVAYWLGLSEAIWTAIGLAVGTYVNWLIVAGRLRRYSAVAGDAITIPEFFSNRFKENKKVIMTIAAMFILVFFTAYVASCFITCGKLFATLFGLPYQSMMIIGALFVIFYTFLGGFLAESVSDFMQGIVMIGALLTVMVLGMVHAGGISVVAENVGKIPGFFDFFGMATPKMVDGVQQVIGGVPQFGSATSFGFLSIVSILSWGLGYFGMPQVLLRFMAIRSADEIKQSRRIAITWCVLSLAFAVAIGLIGRSLFPTAFLTQSTAENIFILISTSFLPPLLAGVVMSGILAATISSSDSYLLIAASCIAKNIYQGVVKKTATDKQVMMVTRITLVLITLLGILLAWKESSVIFKVVAFAWAGFGATFGPLMLFSLFWKNVTRAGAIAGMISGGGMVFIWNFLIKPLGGVFGIYELLPAFLISCIFIVVVSKISGKPSLEIQEEFERAKTFEC